MDSITKKIAKFKIFKYFFGKRDHASLVIQRKINLRRPLQARFYKKFLGILFFDDAVYKEIHEESKNKITTKFEVKVRTWIVFVKRSLMRNNPTKKITKFKIFKYFFAIALTLSLSSCFWVPNWYKPQGYTIFRQMPKGGSPGFNLGWIHGCESGLGTQFGGKMYMTFYTWKKDPDISSSAPDIEKVRRRYPKELKDVNWNDPANIKKNFDDYKAVFWSAHIFCRHSAIGILQTTGSGSPADGFTPPVAGDTRYDPSHHSIGNVWKLHGKGDTRIGTGFW